MKITDEEALKAARLLRDFCRDHLNCIGCRFAYAGKFSFMNSACKLDLPVKAWSFRGKGRHITAREKLEDDSSIDLFDGVEA